MTAKNTKDYKQKEIAYENLIAAQYNQWYHRSYIQKEIDRDFGQFVQENIKSQAKVLDLGCGPASLWPELLQIKNIELTGVDVSPKMIQVAQSRFPKQKFMVGDSENIPFKYHAFDVVICSSVLHHLPSPIQSLKEIKRVLKPGGQLIGREPQSDQFLSEMKNRLVRHLFWSLDTLIKQKAHFSTHQEPEIHEYHHAYQIQEFARDLKKVLLVEKIESKYPFSLAFPHIKDRKYADLILKTDRLMKNHKGNQFFYVATKNKPGSSAMADSTLKEIDRKKDAFPVKFFFRLLELIIYFKLVK